ncbi:hypothetical protein EXS72_00990 [Candidatus Pacearchaeota archaeon]|nr:hypothetical protein [Candidatus Pacearchaeota archaeon]
MSSIVAKFILEILGRPPEHLTSSLSELVTKLGTEKGTSIVSKELHKPKPVEKTDNLWTAFAEIEIKFDSLQHFFNTIIMYMPAHVEIVEPDSFKINSFEINELANFMISRLHNYDAITKKLMGEREILIGKLEHLRKGGKMEDVFAKPQTPQNVQPKIENQIEKKKKSKKKK